METSPKIPLYKKLLEGKQICPSKEEYYLKMLKRRIEFLTYRIENRKEDIAGFDYDKSERNAISFALGKIITK